MFEKIIPATDPINSFQMGYTPISIKKSILLLKSNIKNINRSIHVLLKFLCARELSQQAITLQTHVQYTGDISQNCALETYIILLTNVTPISLI